MLCVTISTTAKAKHSPMHARDPSPSSQLSAKHLMSQICIQPQAIECSKRTHDPALTGGCSHSGRWPRDGTGPSHSSYTTTQINDHKDNPQPTCSHDDMTNESSLRKMKKYLDIYVKSPLSELTLMHCGHKLYGICAAHTRSEYCTHGIRKHYLLVSRIQLLDDRHG